MSPIKSLLPLLLLLFLSSISPSDGQRRLKILVYSPINSWSHMQFLGKIADTLVEAGHEVHYLKFLFDPALELKNETKLVQKVILARPQFTDPSVLVFDNYEPVRNPFGGKGFPHFVWMDNNVKDFWRIFAFTCKEMVSNTPLLDQLASEHYDVAIAEPYDLCAFAIFHRIRVHTKLSAMALMLYQGSAARFGIPIFSSYVPVFASPPLNSPKMSFFERVRNFYNTLYDWMYQYDGPIDLVQPIISEAFGRDFPTLKQLAKNISLVFVNSNEFFEFPRPISHKIVNIGGLVDSKAKKLEKRTDAILAGSKRGAVLVSFGSITDTSKMSSQMRRAFLRAFARFPDYEFIWKMDAASLANDSAMLNAAQNVHTFDWVDQTTILGHPKLRAFISHCGHNSLSESARAGVPVVAIPLFGDQLYNAVMAKHKGMAVYLDVGRLDDEIGGEKLLVDALEKVLHTDGYRSNAQLIRKKSALSPFSPKEKLVRWVEFAAEFPSLPELNLPSDDDIHWAVFYSLDVLLFSALLLTFAFIFAFLAFTKLLSTIVAMGVETKIKSQ